MSTFVPDWLATAIKQYFSKNGTPRSRNEIAETNKYFYLKYPSVSKRSLREATKAIREGDYRTDLKQGHHFNKQIKPIVPEKWSQLDQYYDLMKGFIKKNKPIRIANVQDGHVEQADPALHKLAMQLIQNFQPHVFPVMADAADNTAFAAAIHGKKYYQMEVEKGDIGGAAEIFEQITFDYIDNFSEVLPSYCIKPVVLGNHEAWILRYLADNAEGFASYFLNKFMPALQERDVLWTEGDKLEELWLTDSALAIHGNKARNSYHGATANAYMKHYAENLSILSGHSHRQETVWSKPHPVTGGRHFSNITGTLSDVRRAYMRYRYSGHNPGISLIELAPSGNVGHVVDDVEFYYKQGYWVARWRGEDYVERATKKPPMLNPFVS